MNVYEIIFNFTWVCLGTGICIQSMLIGLWEISGPGSGFFPFLSGLIIGVVGILRFISGRMKGAERKIEVKFWESSAIRKRIVFVLMGFCAMAYLLPVLGFLLASILITSFLLRVIEPKGMIKIIIIAFVSCLSVYVLFVTLLNINLPKGFLGF